MRQLNHILAVPAGLSTMLLVVLAMLAISCGDEESVPSLSRVGERCAAAADCEAGLACLDEEKRCVVLCELGSEDCGPGIACRSAGEVGFCPLPPDVGE